jgi:acyl-CoA thioester hydrolase
MLKTRTTYRVIYGDTDQMGVVYYGTYGRLYEIGRAEMIRDRGFTYKQLEDSGVYMPIYSVHARYLKPLYYDELITIETELKKIPGARIVFYHSIYNEAGELAHSAEVTLVFLDAKTNRPTRAPELLIEHIKRTN